MSDTDTTTAQIPDWQSQAIVTTERVNSVVSICSIMFILVTFLCFPSFNKPINRLIFFAGWGNLGSTIASLISEAGPLAGPDSALCQFQGFLVQMFLGVDTYWAFCMAINVYLAFFRGYSIKQLRALDLPYLLICYGLAFVPALVFIFISNDDRKRVYGPAIIWCWITTKWDFLRIVFLYGIVWAAILVAIAVYIMAGRVIYRKRKYLDGFLNPLNENPFTNLVTTEIRITHEARPSISNDGIDKGTPEIPGTEVSADFTPYSINIETGTVNKPLPALLRMRTLTRDAAQQETNAEAWLYARVAFLFFIALMITWVPSSVNRVYALVYPNSVNFGLNYSAGFVFPLQGFWNVIVYIVTSQTACKELWDSIAGRTRRKRRLAQGMELEGRHPRDRYANGRTRVRLGSVGSAREILTTKSSKS